MTAFPPAVRHFGEVVREARARRRPRAEGQLLGRRDTHLERTPRRPVVIRLWLPLTPIFALLAPLAVLLIPFLYLAPPLRRMNCAAAVFVLGGMLLSLSGTVVDIEAPDARVHIKIV